MGFKFNSAIGRYELADEVGRGSQGVVYRAHDPVTQRPIALKRLLGGSLATLNMRRRLERELEATASLDHPAIVSVFGMDAVDDVPVLAMEWIDGVHTEDRDDRWMIERGGRLQLALESSPHLHRRE